MTDPNLQAGANIKPKYDRKGPRPNRVRDLAEKRFGSLVAISVAERPDKGNKYWVCECDCGTKKEIRSDHLILGMIISCGCAANKGPTVAFRTRKVREQTAVKDHIRRLRKGVTIDWYDPDQIEALYVRQRKRCANCRCKIAPDNWHKDHIVSLSKGGTNSIRNIQLLCIPCNRKKYNKDPIDFAREQGKLL